MFNSEKEKRSTEREIFKKIEKELFPNRRKPVYFKIAASVVFAIVVVSVYTNNFVDYNGAALEVVNTESKPKKVTLSDGSLVTLNENSSLQFWASHDNDSKRLIRLNGEAFFDVESNPKKPFLVQIEDLTTQVVGTQFNIKSNKNNIVVTVVEGLVKVFDNNNSFLVKPNNQVIYSHKNESMYATEVNASVFAFWRHDRVILRDVSLLEFKNVMHSIYGKDSFCFGENIVEDASFTIAFNKQEPIERVIDRYNLISNNNITIKRECDDLK